MALANYISPDEEVNSILHYGNDCHNFFHLPISCSKNIQIDKYTCEIQGFLLQEEHRLMC